MDSELRDRLIEALEAGPRLRLALVFGSVARGTARGDSDLDVAVVPVDPGLSLADELALAVQLERASGRTVDLVRLDQATNALAWRVARDGVTLVSEPPFEAARFRARTAIEHDSDAELNAEAERRYRSALSRGIGAGR